MSPALQQEVLHYAEFLAAKSPVLQQKKQDSQHIVDLMQILSERGTAFTCQGA